MTNQSARSRRLFASYIAFETLFFPLRPKERISPTMFEFVTVNHPDDTRDQTYQKRIRQHAIRNGIQNKRKEEAKNNQNFVTVDFDTRAGRLKNMSPDKAIAIGKSLSVGRLDPFNSLPGDGERLRALMSHSQSSRLCIERTY